MFLEYSLIKFLVCVFDAYLIYDFVGYYEGVNPVFLTKKSRIAVILFTACVTFFINLFNNADLNLFAALACPSVRIYEVLIVKMINYVEYFLIKHLVSQKHDNIDKETFWIFMIIPASGMGLMFSAAYLNNDFPDATLKRGVLYIFYMLMMLGNVLVAYVFRRYVAINKSLQTQKRLIEDYKIQLRYYRQVEDVNKKNAAFHHDMCHYLKVIGSLAENNRNEQILSLLDELQIEFFEVNKQNFCSNPVLNAILNEEIREAGRQRVDCRVYAEPGFSIGSIRETDLISALGNLYKNALEAASKSENGFIKTTMFMENEGRFLVIIVENSYKGAILRDGEKFLTTKENKFIHGIGIERVREIAKRYGGSLRTVYEEGVFRAVLVLST